VVAQVTSLLFGVSEIKKVSLKPGFENSYWRAFEYCSGRSASSHELSVRRTRLWSYGDRDFLVAAVRIWNNLSQHITSAPSVPVFCSCLKSVIRNYCCRAREVTLSLDTLIALT